MKNIYLDSLMKITPRDLVYKFEKDYIPEDHYNIIIRESYIGDNAISVVRHKWDMHAMYHLLKMYKLAYVYSGAFVVYVDGRATRLGKGSLCIVPPDVIQKFTIDHDENNSDDPVMINILLRTSLIKETLASLLSSKNEVSDYINKSLLSETFPKFMVLHTPSEFTADMAELFFSENIRSGGSKASMCLLNAFIFSYLRDGAIVEYSVTNTDRSEAIYRILKCIQTEFRTVTLETLCERFHYTPSYICRIIKRHTGMTFKEYLCAEKLGCARKELAISEKTINVIAAESGWQTLEHFYRVFKKKYGITPLQYRESVKKDLYANT